MRIQFVIWVGVLGAMTASVAQDFAAGRAHESLAGIRAEAASCTIYDRPHIDKGANSPITKPISAVNAASIEGERDSWLSFTSDAFNNASVLSFSS